MKLCGVPPPYTLTNVSISYPPSSSIHSYVSARSRKRGGRKSSWNQKQTTAALAEDPISSFFFILFLNNKKILKEEEKKKPRKMFYKSGCFRKTELRNGFLFLCLFSHGTLKILMRAHVSFHSMVN